MELTLDQLKQYDGTDPSNPIYIGVKGRIFDVSTAKSFYGPGGSYAMFAGKDASRALAKMSKNDEDVIGSLHGLTEKELGEFLMIGKRNSKLSTQLLVLSLLN
uniref:Cytochrome b5 heme-binding domain-containing protein n=1 Tax=Lactuca sativa TaxID=4236 RepID=A0A9R1WAW0_LACSA|nr:hypothetical protein LSAT_V11C300109830 [Lactuca sativa]